MYYFKTSTDQIIYLKGQTICRVTFILILNSSKLRQITQITSSLLYLQGALIFFKFLENETVTLDRQLFCK